MKIKGYQKARFAIKMNAKEFNKVMDRLNDVLEYLDEAPQSINGVDKPKKAMKELADLLDQMESASFLL